MMNEFDVSFIDSGLQRKVVRTHKSHMTHLLAHCGITDNRPIVDQVRNTGTATVKGFHGPIIITDTGK